MEISCHFKSSFSRTVTRWPYVVCQMTDNSIINKLAGQIDAWLKGFSNNPKWLSKLPNPMGCTRQPLMINPVSSIQAHLLPTCYSVDMSRSFALLLRNRNAKLPAFGATMLIALGKITFFVRAEITTPNHLSSPALARRIPMYQLENYFSFVPLA